MDELDPTTTLILKFMPEEMARVAYLLRGLARRYGLPEAGDIILKALEVAFFVAEDQD